MDAYTVLLLVGAALVLYCFVASIIVDERENKLKYIKKAHAKDLREEYSIPTQEELNDQALRREL